MQPASAALLNLQILAIIPTLHGFSIFSSTRLLVQHGSSKLRPTAHRRRRTKNAINILNILGTQNLPQIQRLKGPRRNYHRATLNRQQRKKLVRYALSPNLIIDATKPKQPPLFLNSLNLSIHRVIRNS
jgi:hypothetical protein